MTARFRFLVIAALAIPSITSLAPAQAALAAEDRVRLHHKDGTISKGFVHWVTPERLRLRSDFGDTSLVVGFDTLTGIERSSGIRRHFGRNFVKTAGISALVFGAMGAMTWAPCTDTGFLACYLHPPSRADAAGVGAFVGAALGIPLGLIIGGAIKSEHWQALPGFPGPSDVSVRPILGKRVGLSAAFAFGHR